MLVLSRKVGEELVIGDNIRIVIQRVAGNRVSVGIEAPLEVSIVRGELKEIHDDFRHDASKVLECSKELESSNAPESGNVRGFSKVRGMSPARGIVADGESCEQEVHVRRSAR